MKNILITLPTIFILALQAWLLYENNNIQKDIIRVTERQNELSNVNNQIQENLSLLIQEQGDIDKTIKELEYIKSKPIIRYKRKPELQYTDKKLQKRGPDRGNIINSYPDNSYFYIFRGAGTIKSVEKRLYGAIYFAPHKCAENINPSVPLNHSRPKFIKVGFGDTILSYNNSTMVQSSDTIGLDDISTTWHEVITPNFQRNLKDIKEKFEKLTSGCLVEFRIYGVFKVQYIDLYSNSETVYFSSYLSGETNITDREEWDLFNSKHYPCTLYDHENILKKCSEVILKKYNE